MNLVERDVGYFVMTDKLIEYYFPEVLLNTSCFYLPHRLKLYSTIEKATIVANRKGRTNKVVKLIVKVLGEEK